MKNIMKNRRALSTVVTTLIILVVSVLLAGVVTYFAINVVSTRVQEESLNLQYAHVWYSTADSEAEAAIVITNTGGRDVVLQNIAVRGQSVSMNDTEYYVPSTIADLSYVSAKNAFPTTSQAWTNVTSGSSIVLGSGDTIVVYMFSWGTFSPGSVTVNDVGLTIAISIFTAQATYYKETNVNAA
jgi:type II secretory pathway pseudopilin PulG